MGKKKSYEVSQSSSIGTMEEVELTKIVFTLRDDDADLSECVENKQQFTEAIHSNRLSFNIYDESDKDSNAKSSSCSIDTTDGSTMTKVNVEEMEESTSSKNSKFKKFFSKPKIKKFVLIAIIYIVVQTTSILVIPDKVHKKVNTKPTLTLRVLYDTFSVENDRAERKTETFFQPAKLSPNFVLQEDTIEPANEFSNTPSLVESSGDSTLGSLQDIFGKLDIEHSDENGTKSDDNDYYHNY